MVTDRQEGDIHYYDYGPTDIHLHHGRDAYTIARAYLSVPGNPFSYGIVILISGAEQRDKAFDREEAIQRGRAIIHRLLVEERGIRQIASALTADETHIFTWQGKPVA